MNVKELKSIIFEIVNHPFWRDIRHCQVFAWMVAAIIDLKSININDWANVAQSRAEQAESHERRFIRWLQNDRIVVNELYGPIIQEALKSWGEDKLRLALDTSVIFEEFCLMRISVIYRGRAVVLVQKVIEHASAAVSFEMYKELLEEAAKLVPVNTKIIFTADRGFLDKKLMEYLDKELGWTYLIRVKKNIKVKIPGQKRAKKIGSIGIERGQAIFWQGVYLTGEEIGPVYLAMGRSSLGKEAWYLVSNESVGEESFKEYSLRFDIEEEFLDDKSNGFQLEDSRLREAKVLTRLLMVVAVATVYLVSQGTEVVKEGKRRVVDSHWFRGMSYLKIGWAWIRRALSGVKGCIIMRCVKLIGGADPEPARSSKKAKPKKHFYTFETKYFHPLETG